MFKLKLLKFYYKLYSNLLPQYFECYRDVIDRAPLWELRQHYRHPPPPLTNKTVNVVRCSTN